MAARARHGAVARGLHRVDDRDAEHAAFQRRSHRRPRRRAGRGRPGDRPPAAAQRRRLAARCDGRGRARRRRRQAVPRSRLPPARRLTAARVAGGRMARRHRDHPVRDRLPGDPPVPRRSYPVASLASCARRLRDRGNHLRGPPARGHGAARRRSPPRRQRDGRGLDPAELVGGVGLGPRPVLPRVLGCERRPPGAVLAPCGRRAPRSAEVADERRCGLCRLRDRAS